ncbi:MAG: hypothetical protein DMG13_03480 [Acidobacteria bacterium]|nr:MAG: hypothetical protein DMG13_03480 [Acidobacteriota bacterium]
MLVLEAQQGFQTATSKRICGRKVKVQTRTKSQTVNICSSRNLHGEYDYVIRLRAPFISEETLRQKNFSSIEELVRYVQSQHFGEIEKSPVYRPTEPRQLSSNITAAAAVSPAQSTPELPKTANSSWELAAKLAVEKSIDQFILEFIQFPYLHRVEHSIHCELFKILTSRKMLSSTYPMGRWATQPVHKEWPEVLPRPEKGNRRGNFDLSVLTPQRLKSCSFADFR